MFALPWDVTQPRTPGIFLSQLLHYFQYFDWQWSRGVQGTDVLLAGLRLPFTLLFLSLGVWGAVQHHRRDRASLPLLAGPVRDALARARGLPEFRIRLLDRAGPGKLRFPQAFRGIPATADLKVTERFSRVDEETSVGADAPYMIRMPLGSPASSVTSRQSWPSFFPSDSATRISLNCRRIGRSIHQTIPAPSAPTTMCDSKVSIVSHPLPVWFRSPPQR